MNGAAATPRHRRAAVEGFDAAAIRAARMLLDVSRAELAEAVEVSERTLGGWERGEVVPTVAKVGRLVAYMEGRGVTVNDAIRQARGLGVDQPDAVERAILDDASLPMRERRELVRLRREMQRRP